MEDFNIRAQMEYVWHINGWREWRFGEIYLHNVSTFYFNLYYNCVLLLKKLQKHLFNPIQHLICCPATFTKSPKFYVFTTFLRYSLALDNIYVSIAYIVQVSWKNDIWTYLWYHLYKWCTCQKIQQRLVLNLIITY